jgi:hypothetical protein
MEEIKPIIIYTTESKRETVKKIAKKKRTSVTKLVEGEIDKLIKREDTEK